MLLGECPGVEVQIRGVQMPCLLDTGSQDFVIGGVKVPDRGVIIVEDSAQSAEQGILGMNVISHCWEELFGGVSPRLRSFESAMSTKARGEWDKAFVVCRKVEREEAPDGKIPPQSEMVVWTQVIKHPARTEYCALVEAIEEDAEWQVARTLAWYLHPDLVEVDVRPVHSSATESEPDLAFEGDGLSPA
ncbi:hypothetical protein HHUSO_G36325, partial [Huso huso]